MSSIFVRRSAEARNLALLGTVSKLLDVSDPDDMAQLKRLLQAVSRTVEEITGRVFARELVTEKFGMDEVDSGDVGRGRAFHRIMLQRRPVLMVEAMRYEGVSFDISHVVLEDSEAGFLFSTQGFVSTMVYYQQIERVRTDFLAPVWEVDYSGGYVLPGFPEVEKTFVSGDVNVSTDKITIAAHGLVTGDTVRFSAGDPGGILPVGLAEDLDFFVRDATDNDFKVAARLNGAAIDFTDGGTGEHTISRRTTLPGSLENLVVEWVVSKWHSRKRDITLVSERLGDYSVNYSDPARSVEGTAGDAPPSIRAALERWRDVVA